MDDATGRPPIASVLERWRVGLGLSKQRLADLADVSATYVRLIEAGRDDDDRIVVPSAGIIQKLARGLARAEPGESTQADIERRAYSDLISAAGYLAPLVGLAPEPTVSLDGVDNGAQRPTVRSAGVQTAPTAPEIPSTHYEQPSAPCAPLEKGGSEEARSVVLRDERLHRDLLPLLEGWERLDSRDQSLLLDLFELVAGRCGRRWNQD